VGREFAGLIGVRQLLARSGGTMTDIQQSPQLLRLCELASKEHDPQKLVRLILKINQKLDELLGESELSLPEAADCSRPTIPLSMFVDRKLKFGVVPSAQ